MFSVPVPIKCPSCIAVKAATVLTTVPLYFKSTIDIVGGSAKSDHEKAEEDITKSGESEELLLFLAGESKNETGAWYACQSKNTSELTV